MGVDVHKIMDAIKAGKIKAKKLTDYDYKTGRYHITMKAARQYIIDWLPEINITYCDKYWLVDLLSMSAQELREAGL